jgi:hypothetical protein
MAKQFNKMLKFSTIARILFACYLVVIVYLLLSKPTGNIPKFDLSFWIFPDDKVKHVLLFSPYMVLQFFSKLNKPFIVLFFIGIFVCSAAESMHYFVPYREFSIFDFFANLIGLTFGSIGYFILNYVQKR